ncbi:hypothetical protein, partial [Bacillus altitudinis]|uniref:hypothetical protein n=1 Tax=Bacillus altitudinis TaxID=293387 RepID=UPI001C92D0C7
MKQIRNMGGEVINMIMGDGWRVYVNVSLCRRDERIDDFESGGFAGGSRCNEYKKFRFVNVQIKRLNGIA